MTLSTWSNLLPLKLLQRKAFWLLIDPPHRYVHARTVSNDVLIDLRVPPVSERSNVTLSK